MGKKKQENPDGTPPEQGELIPRKDSLPEIPPFGERTTAPAAKKASALRIAMSDGKELSDEEQRWLFEYEKAHPPGGPRSIVANQKHTEFKQSESNLSIDNGPHPLSEREAGRRLDNVIDKANSTIEKALLLTDKAFERLERTNDFMLKVLGKFSELGESGWENVNKLHATTLNAHVQTANLQIEAMRKDMEHQQELIEAEAKSPPPFGLDPELWEELQGHAKGLLPDIGPRLIPLVGFLIEGLKNAAKRGAEALAPAAEKEAAKTAPASAAQAVAKVAEAVKSVAEAAKPAAEVVDAVKGVAPKLFTE